MLERTDAITNEVLEPIMFVLAYPTVFILHLTSHRKTSWVSMSPQTFVVRKFKLLKAQRLRTGKSKLFNFGQRATTVTVG
jgi:hypothetical protein